VKGRKAVRLVLSMKGWRRWKQGVTKGELLAYARGLNIGSKQVLLVPRVNGLTSERSQGCADWAGVKSVSKQVVLVVVVVSGRHLLRVEKKKQSHKLRVS